MFYRVVVLSLVVLAASLRLAAAQDKPAVPDAARFNTQIVVTPERGATPREDAPAATVVLDEADIKALPAIHPSEVMSFVPGFHLARPQFYAGRPVVSARGFFGGGEAEYILLLVDGVPVADVESGLVDWSALPASSIRRVEAFRGPGASLYGDSAIGGVVQIFTNRSITAGQLNLTGGSFNTFTADGSYGRRLRSVGVNVSAAGRRTDGGYEHSSAQQMVASGALDGAFKRLAWRWNVSGDTRDRDDPGALTTAALADTPYASDPLSRFDTVDRQNFSTAMVLRDGTSRWMPQARVYISTRDEDLVRTILLVPEFGDTRARALSSTVAGGSVEGERSLRSNRPIVTRFGLDLSREQLDTTYRSVEDDGSIGGLNSEASGHRVRAGLFASTSWQAAARVRLIGAVRWDNVDDAAFRSAAADDGESQRAWSPRAGVVVHVADRGAVTLFGQVSRAFKVPTLDQLFDPRPYPDFAGGSFTISNPGLVPQRATNSEVGISGGTRLHWSALAYHMRVDDEIDFDVQRFSYANIGESRHTGLELELDGRWWNRLSPSVAYALSRVVAGEDEQQLRNVPRHLVTLGLGAELPWAVGVFARYQRSWGGFLDNENLIAIDGPSTLDIRVRRSLGKHSLFADLVNITGDRYEEYGFTLNDFTGGVVPYAYPGAPRAVRAGLTVVF